MDHQWSIINIESPYGGMVHSARKNNVYIQNESNYGKSDGTRG